MPLKLIISVASRITQKAKIEAQILAAEAVAKMKAEVELKKQREREEKLLELHYKRLRSEHHNIKRKRTNAIRVWRRVKK
ncbi:hypothetical protein V6Z12_A08G063500 [Gossypium hirsutum]